MSKLKVLDWLPLPLTVRFGLRCVSWLCLGHWRLKMNRDQLWEFDRCHAAVEHVLAEDSGK
jgi:hypothetical protein